MRHTHQPCQLNARQISTDSLTAQLSDTPLQAPSKSPGRTCSRSGTWSLTRSRGRTALASSKNSCHTATLRRTSHTLRYTDKRAESCPAVERCERRPPTPHPHHLTLPPHSLEGPLVARESCQPHYPHTNPHLNPPPASPSPSKGAPSLTPLSAVKKGVGDRGEAQTSRKRTHFTPRSLPPSPPPSCTFLGFHYLPQSAPEAPLRI